MSKILVIGAGAAGMMAACAAASNGHEVHLFEKNEKVGKKIYITGKGRCNLTNDCQREDFFSNVVRNPRFLYGAYAAFDTTAVQSFFEAQGLSLKVERGNRVFPMSDHASDVIKALESCMRKNGVRVHLNTPVASIEADDCFHAIILHDGSRIEGDACIIATGGLSYPSTGSTGDGYQWARVMGHTVNPCYPSLVSLHTEQAFVRKLAGLTLKNVAIRLMDEEHCVYSDFGELLFTHRGVSGPVILSASAHASSILKERYLMLYIDLKPALDEKTLDMRILREFEQSTNKQFKNVLAAFLPHKLIPVFAEMLSFSPDTPVHQITKEMRREFLKTLKCLPLTVIGPGGYEEAVVTAGGVNVKEVNPRTMESKLVKGIYWAGEVLDVDAMTGGYNLQIAWSCGHAAGSNDFS